MDRIILHSDINNFYASVECALNPALKSSAIAVCGDPDKRHGIVLAKNGIAKAYGIKTGDVLWEARKKCPDIIFVPAKFPKYLEYSKIVKAIYNKYTDKVESFGLDECWLDVTHTAQLFGGVEKLTESIRGDIREQTGLTVSIGVSFNKIFAKLGSDLKKPDAVTVISRDNFKKKIWPLAAGELLYVGKQTAKKLKLYGINTIGDIANSEQKFLKTKLGKWGDYLWEYANGLDVSEVGFAHIDTAVKSVSNSTTAIRDLVSITDVTMIITVLSESVALRLRESGLKANTVSIMIRDNTLFTTSRQKKLDISTNMSSDIIKAAKELFAAGNFDKSVRAVGISAGELTPANSQVQLSFFRDEAAISKKEKLEKSIDKIRYKFGHNAIVRCNTCQDGELTGFNPEEDNINSFYKP